MDRTAPASREAESVQKLDNVTWFGHCAVHITHALQDLPTRGARIQFIENLSSFIANQRRGIRHYGRKRAQK